METNGSNKDGRVRKKKIERMLAFCDELGQGNSCVIKNSVYTLDIHGELEVLDFYYKKGEPVSAPSIETVMNDLVMLSLQEFNSMSLARGVFVLKDMTAGTDGQRNFRLPGARKWYKDNVSALLTLGRFLLFVREKREVMAQDGVIYSLQFVEDRD